MEDISFNEDIRQAVAALRSGGVILYPTDTVWGLGCDATNAEAVERVFRLKGRSGDKSLICLADGAAMVERYTGALPETAEMLIEAADGPLTIVYPRSQGLAPGVAATDGSAAFRITAEDYSRELCRRLGRPIVSTSANKSGRPAAALYREIADEIKDGADYAAYYHREDTERALPSEVIRLNADGSINIIRGR